MTRIPGAELEADGWEGKREVEAVVVDGVMVEMVEAEEVVEMVEAEEVVDGVVVVVVGAQVDTTENEQMGMRRENNWEAGRKTILEADDKRVLSSQIVAR